VLVVQDCLIEYMRKEFAFEHVHDARSGDPMHLHPHAMSWDRAGFRIALNSRLSTDSQGVSRCLGSQAEANVELSTIGNELEGKISRDTLFVPA